jgi:tetratricopeptide (TPR) repeat protein
MEAATDPRQPSADATGVPLLWRYQPERFLGEIFEEAGDLERAADWYNSAAQSMDVVAPSWEDTGRIYDQMGDSENAIRYYSLFVDYWKNADSVLQPRVRAARDRIDALLAEQTREPQ